MARLDEGHDRILTIRNHGPNGDGCNPDSCKYVRIDAYERSPLSGLHIKNCRFMNVRSGNILNHVNGLKVENLKINGRPVDDQLESP